MCGEVDEWTMSWKWEVWGVVEVGDVDVCQSSPRDEQG